MNQYGGTAAIAKLLYCHFLVRSHLILLKFGMLKHIWTGNEQFHQTLQPTALKMVMDGRHTQHCFFCLKPSSVCLISINFLYDSCDDQQKISKILITGGWQPFLKSLGRHIAVKIVRFFWNLIQWRRLVYYMIISCVKNEIFRTWDTDKHDIKNSFYGHTTTGLSNFVHILFHEAEWFEKRPQVYTMTSRWNTTKCCCILVS